MAKEQVKDPLRSSEKKPRGGKGGKRFPTDFHINLVMASASKPKAKSTRLTEFFHSSQTQEVEKYTLPPPSSPDLSLTTESLDLDISDSAASQHHMDGFL